MISPKQCRAARAWLGIDQKELALEAGCNRDTLRRFEREVGQLRTATEAAIRAALEAKGILFTFSIEGYALGIQERRP